MERLSKYAGVTRPGNIKITGSTHIPVEAKEVPRFLEEFCDYINDNWHDKNAIHLSAYSLWKINWIHPFVDGNGRTSRILSYLIICAKLGYRLPGVKTVPDQIASNKHPYYKALEAADVAFSAGRIDVGELEKLVDAHLAVQLLDIHKRAASGNGDDRAAVAEMPEYGPPKSLINIENNFNLVSHIEKHPVVYTFIGGFVLLVISALLS
ncbi:Fic family protein [Pararhizobium sp. PWRC1-1]|uniref:Fic family protein n=1 Tax=Pararhizobium sp. PWRC1-1 TaxID=2804566 RepID=UPI003CEA14E4